MSYEVLVAQLQRFDAVLEAQSSPRCLSETSAHNAARIAKQRLSNRTPDSSALDFALNYVAAGYRVFPTRGKIPRVKHGAHDSSTSPAQLREWWARWPDAGIGLTLGGPVAVDVDPRNGGDIEALPQTLPHTCHARTGGGGMHYLYQIRLGAEYPGKFAPGIDIKSGDGSYICVEPSVHSSGNKYAWLDGTSPWTTKPAEAPKWLER